MDLVDLAVPPGGAEGPSIPRATPLQLVSIYNEDQWEAFTTEWLNSLTQYRRIQRTTGAGDRGIDVVGLHDDQGLAGAWDCYQCKHYDRPLQPADAFPEVYKILLGVLDDAFVMPQNYYFVAPQNAGVKFTRQLSTPSQLREAFLAAFADPPQWLQSMPSDQRDKVLAKAKTTDFRVFQLFPVEAVLEAHSHTNFFAARFATALAAREAAESPPPVPDDAESRYVEQLVAVYGEKYGLGTPWEFGQVMTNEKAAEQMQRQRVAFYEAEALRRFARDQVPDGTFESLQEQLYDGVINSHDASYAMGFDRLMAVLATAQELAMGDNALLPRVQTRDRHGICHQLANKDRLTWMQS